MCMCVCVVCALRNPNEFSLCSKYDVVGDVCVKFVTLCNKQPLITFITEDFLYKSGVLVN